MNAVAIGYGKAYSSFAPLMRRNGPPRQKDDEKDLRQKPQVPIIASRPDVKKDVTFQKSITEGSMDSYSTAPLLTDEISHEQDMGVPKPGQEALLDLLTQSQKRATPSGKWGFKVLRQLFKFWAELVIRQHSG